MKRWQFWVGIALSAGFLYLALRGLGLKEVWEPLKSARYWWLLPGVGVYFVGVWIRAWRWHYLLRPLKAVSTPKMFPIVAIGYMGNNIYPARAGEILRAFVLKRKQDISISASLATIVVERVFDGVVMLGFVFLNLPALVASGYIVSAVLGSVLFLGALGVFLAAAMFPERAEKVAAWLIQRLVPEKYREKVKDIMSRFLDGLESLRSPREAIMVLLTSVVIWLLETGKYWFVMQAFDFQVSYFALMLMNGIVNLATTIPSAPGYVGTFDAPGIAVLTAYGVDQGIATGYTLVLHAALWLPITVLGAYYMLREGIRWQGGEILESAADSGKGS